MRRVLVLLVVVLGLLVQLGAMRDIAAGADHAGPSLGDLKRSEAIDDENVRRAVRGP